MNSPRLLVIVLVALAAFVLGGCRAHFLCDRGDAACVEESDLPSKGPATAPVLIEEFSEFQCPFCRRVQPTLRELQDRYPGKLRFVFRNFPLAFHEHADLAARAGVAALLQGKFWPYHDFLFEEGRLGREDLIAAAAKVGLDVQQFRADLDDARVASTVARDLGRGRDLGVTGVPHFRINGRVVSGAQPVHVFAATIDEELAKAEAVLAEGVAPEDVARILTERNVRGDD